MNIEITMEASAVVTPKLAMASRSQTTSYTKPQNPEITKKAKNHHNLGAEISIFLVLNSFCLGESGIVVISCTWHWKPLHSFYSKE
jgi:hypothetical protein